MKRAVLSSLLLILVLGVPASSQPPTGCPPWQLGQYLETGSRDGVKTLVRTFIVAYNRGDLERLNEIFPQEPGFEGYWDAPERSWEKGEDRFTLIDYFERRHSLNDRLTLKTLRIQREREQAGWDFYFEVRRSSDQKRARGLHVGKGAADCAMVFWNMGRPKS